LLYPAVKVHGVDGIDDQWLLAVADDFDPTAVEEHGSGAVSIFFASGDARDRAHEAIRSAFPHATLSKRDVDDGDWARRSQENLTAIMVGRITVAPPWMVPSIPQSPIPQSPIPQSQVVVILPSMGFGTGHHATTRLCLQALQAIDVRGRTMLDVGTGSGVLAIAARMLGARTAVGIDHDPDALQAARENLGLNAGVDAVTFEVGDLSKTSLDAADVVTANLTGALLCRAATTLDAAVRSGGRLILSGLLTAERNDVLSAFDGWNLVWEQQEDGWAGLILQK
jgi:ribosomal protein L11 methyltransferase